MQQHQKITQADQEHASQVTIQNQQEEEELSPEKAYAHPLERVRSGIGDQRTVASHVSLLQRTGLFKPGRGRQRNQSLRQLQRRYGNRFVQRVIAQHAIQAKMKVSRPGDVYEQEADRVANTIMHMPGPLAMRHEQKKLYRQ